MKSIHLFMSIAFGLLSCTPAPTPPTFTPVSSDTATLSVATIESTPNSTLSPEQYPSMPEISLKPEDVNVEDFSNLFVSSFFRDSISGSVKPAVYDKTKDLISANECYVDCNKTLWANGEYKVSLILIRRLSSKEAQQASQDYCFAWFPKTVYKPTKYEDCLYAVREPLMIPNTWAFDRVFGGRYGVINIFADMDYIGGDDGTIYQLILTDLVKLQVNKFIMAGIPSVP